MKPQINPLELAFMIFFMICFLAVMTVFNPRLQHLDAVAACVNDNGNSFEVYKACERHHRVTP